MGLKPIKNINIITGGVSMFKKIMSAILSLAMAASFSVCALADGEPSDEASTAAPIEEEKQEETQQERPNASAIAIWGGTGACAVVIAALMIWKNKKDDFN